MTTAISIKISLNHIIYSNAIVAVSTGILSAGFAYQLGNLNWWIYGLISLFATLAVYNGQRLFKADQPNLTPWLMWVKRNEKSIFLFVVSCSVIAAAFLLLVFKWELHGVLVLIASAFMSSFYVLKIFGKNLREIPHIKIHLISATWVLFLIVYPMINEGINTKVLESAAGHYLYILAVTIPFDIRDLKYDAHKQRTLPQLIGVNASKALSVVLLGIVMTVFPLAFTCLQWNPLFYAAILIQMALIIGMNENKTDFYCAGLIDGAISILGLSYFIC